jgi:hypothetical protein
MSAVTREREIRERLSTLPYAIRYTDEEVADLATMFDRGDLSDLTMELMSERLAHLQADNYIKAEIFEKFITKLTRFAKAYEHKAEVV